MREEIGDVMNKLKKTAAVAAMVGGLGLVGGGVASADDGLPFVLDNLQVVKCEQAFGSEGLGASPTGTIGDSEQTIGNSCTPVHAD